MPINLNRQILTSGTLKQFVVGSDLVYLSPFLRRLFCEALVNHGHDFVEEMTVPITTISPPNLNDNARKSN